VYAGEAGWFLAISAYNYVVSGDWGLVWLVALLNYVEQSNQFWHSLQPIYDWLERVVGGFVVVLITLKGYENNGDSAWFGFSSYKS